jgi:malonyl-CoA/methylmalonyl-CoA synthetase
MKNENLYSLFESRFPSDRRRPLLILDSGVELSYAQAEEGSARYASLLASHGAVPGDRVAVQVEKSPEALLLYLACLRAGLVYLPLNSAYQEGEIGYFLGDAQPRVVIAQPSSMAWLPALAKRLGIAHAFSLDDEGGGSWVDAAKRQAATFTNVPRGAGDLAAILYTSGTTGRSKGAMITHGNLASNALALHKSWGFGPDDVLVHMLPLFHVHGLFVACHCVLLNGTAMRFHARFDPRRALADFRASTVFMGVPTFYARLIAEPRGVLAHAPLHLRLRAAAGRNARGVREPHGPSHPRALRHDRDRDAHLEPAAGRSACGLGGAAAPGRRGASGR